MKKELTRENMTADERRELQDIVSRLEKIIEKFSEIRDIDNFCAKYANKIIDYATKARSQIYDLYGI